MLCKYYSTIKSCNRPPSTSGIHKGSAKGDAAHVCDVRPRGSARNPAPAMKPLLLPPRPPATQACSVEPATGAQSGLGIKHAVGSHLETGPALDSWHSRGTHLVWSGGLWALQLAWLRLELPPPCISSLSRYRHPSRPGNCSQPEASWPRLPFRLRTQTLSLLICVSGGGRSLSEDHRLLWMDDPSDSAQAAGAAAGAKVTASCFSLSV